MYVCFTFFIFFWSQQLKVFLVAQSVFSNKESKISFSDRPAPDIDFSNTISPQRGGRKQSWTASCFRHVLLTLAGLLGGGGSLFLHVPNQPATGLILHTKNREGSPKSVDTVKKKHKKKQPRFYTRVHCSEISVADWYSGPLMHLPPNKQQPLLIKVQRSGSRSERLKLSDCPTYQPHPTSCCLDSLETQSSPG